MKYNFVIVLKTDQAKVEEVRGLSEFEPDISVSDVGWIALAGAFEEDAIKDYEHYSLATDWQTECGWKDRPL